MRASSFACAIWRDPNSAVEVKLLRGASSTIKAVSVDGQAGQHVQGDYGLDGSWDASAPVQALTWEGDSVLYVITTHEQNAKISRTDLVATAESIGQ